MGKYDFQTDVVEQAVEWLRVAAPGERRLYASPTGTGKSYMELGVLNRLPGSFLLTPRVEIINDMVQKGGDPLRISTPLVYRNRLLAGEWREAKYLILDEAHHHSAETYQLIDLLCGSCPTIGFTATPYRGTSRSTAEFHKRWGDAQWVMTYPEAIAHGVLSMPTCRIVPLIDDDKVKVFNGQFEVESLESATIDRLHDAVGLLQGAGDRPTMVSVPSWKIARRFGEVMTLKGLPNVVVTGETRQEDRRAAFEACVACRAVLVQIQVVSEGVDLPIRRLLDLHPMMSPVEWMQQLGRITRPVGAGEPPPEYIGTNRNLLRHCYLLEGCVPPQIVTEGDKLFGGPSKRLGARGLGLESLGRFKGAEIPFADGTTGVCYSVSTCEGVSTRQFVCVVHPLRGEPLWAVRENQRSDDPMKPHYGRWSRCEPPPDLTGFSSMSPSQVTEKQAAWWKRSAERFGLDATTKVTRKNFCVLPVLSDLRTKI